MVKILQSEAKYICMCVAERERERERERESTTYMELMTYVYGPSLLSRFVPTCSYGLLCLFRHYVGKICSICSNAIGCHVSFDLCLGICSLSYVFILWPVFSLCSKVLQFEIT